MSPRSSLAAKKLSLRQAGAKVFRLPVVRPKVRSECKNGPRPCPWLGCRYHLGLSVRRDGDVLLRKQWEQFLAGEGVEPVGPSCALDVAETMAVRIAEGGTPLSHDDLARTMAVRKSALQRAEEKGMAKLRALGWPLPGKSDENDDG